MLEPRGAPPRTQHGSSAGVAPLSTATSKPSPAARASPCSDVMSGEERWRILRLHVEDQIPLTALAKETGIGLRTLQRWNQLYRDHGITALDPHPRADAGTRRTAAELVAFIERLALTKPRPALATLHRLVSTEAKRQGLAVPATPPSETLCSPSIQRS
ncbi:helix-turn-helix domain-containing protein [Saxibacter everestensis]|uniref:helix-turn-helix domain-containing protein n=1 Tax=Saxibacter everestensis TaxID=2909229 RepID=UPI0032E360E5